MQIYLTCDNTMQIKFCQVLQESRQKGIPITINALIPGGVSVPYVVEWYASFSIKATE